MFERLFGFIGMTARNEKQESQAPKISQQIDDAASSQFVDPPWVQEYFDQPGAVPSAAASAKRVDELFVEKLAKFNAA